MQIELLIDLRHMIDVLINDAGLATARVDCSVFTLTELGPKEAEMRIICDLHARQQTLAMLDSTTGEVLNGINKSVGTSLWHR